MQKTARPYLVIPFFVDQPTWGGKYIVRAKGWEKKEAYAGRKIGQSYELFSKSRLAIDIFSTEDPTFMADEKDKRIEIGTMSVTDITGGIPLPLIKFTQALGNSFQLHKKPANNDARWMPKAESWYYFEPGKITFGVKNGVDMSAYKRTCVDIETKMKQLSKKIVGKEINLDVARKEAVEFIKTKNPWQFVNVYSVPADGVVDLSGGGLHHSWEEDMVLCPHGNVLYEVQQDVMDPESTIRSFDQGKIMDDGTIRTIHIDDYFSHIDTSIGRNTLSLKAGTDGLLFNTQHYKLEKKTVTANLDRVTPQSFHHVFVKRGTIDVTADTITITVGEGHSCFVPGNRNYTIHPHTPSVLLTTFL